MATKYFTTTVDVQTYTEKVVHEALERVAEQTLAKWKGLVKRRVYEEGRLKADPSNDYYKRTSQLLDSLELQWINPLKVVLYYNTEKILPSMMTDRKSFNRHTSFSGEDWSAVIPTFIEQGNGDSIKHSYEGIGAWEEIIEMLNQEYGAMLHEEVAKILEKGL